MLPPDLHQTAARIFVFDLILQNADRRDEKPNSFLAEGKIYVYDHELSFGFLSMLPMFANPTPWILSDTDVRAARQHLFYPLIKQHHNINWDAAFSTVAQLTPLFWQRATELMPVEWENAQEMTRIHAHIFRPGRCSNFPFKPKPSAAAVSFSTCRKRTAGYFRAANSNRRRIETMEDNVHTEPGLFVRRSIPIEQGFTQRQRDAEQGSAVPGCGPIPIKVGLSR